MFQSYNPTQAHSRDELLSGKLSYLILPLHCCREKRKISVIRATVASVTPSVLLLLFWTMVSQMHAEGLIPVCAETNTCIHVCLSTHMYSSTHTPAQVLMEKFHSVWFFSTCWRVIYSRLDTDWLLSDNHWLLGKIGIPYPVGACLLEVTFCCYWGMWCNTENLLVIALVSSTLANFLLSGRETAKNVMQTGNRDHLLSM